MGIEAYNVELYYKIPFIGFDSTDRDIVFLFEDLSANVFITAAILLMSLNVSEILHVANGLRWMTALDDYDYVCQLSIPGTHDTGTGNGFEGIGAIGGIVAGKTQDKNFSEQLKLGVRAFDLRPGVDGSTLPIFHGPLKTKLTMNKVFVECISFLSANPGEFLIFIIRHETEGDSNNSNWAGNMIDHCNKYGDIIVPFSPKLRVGEVRGKIIVLTRSAFSDSKVATISGWGDNATFRTGSIKSSNGNATLWLQDHYEISDEQVKADAVVSLLDKCATLCRDESSFGTWVINHASGYKGSATNSNNSTNAKKTAEAIITRLLAQGRTPGPTGIVLMDYAGTDAVYNGTSLVDAIIDNNSRYHKGILRLPVPEVRWETYAGNSGENVVLKVSVAEGIPDNVDVQHIAYDNHLRSLGDEVSTRKYGVFSKGFTWNFSGDPATVSPIYRARLSGDSYIDSEEVISVFDGDKVTLEPDIFVEDSPLSDGQTISVGQTIRFRKESGFEASGPFEARKVVTWNASIPDVAKSSFIADGEYETFEIPASLAGESISLQIAPALESGMNQFFTSSPRIYKLNVAKDTPTGIEDIAVDCNAHEEVYTIDGLRVTGKNLKKGVYIVVRNGKTSKLFTSNK